MEHLVGLKHIPIRRLLLEPLYLTEKGISCRYAMEQALAARGYELQQQSMPPNMNM